MPRDYDSSEHSCPYYLLKTIIILIKLGICGALVINILLYALSVKSSMESGAFTIYEKIFIVLSALGFVFLAVIQIIAEIGWRCFRNRIVFMKVMAMRGFLLGWQGVQTIDNSTTDAGKSVTDVNQHDYSTVSDVVGWVLIGCGMAWIVICTCQFKRMVGLDTSHKPSQMRSDSHLDSPAITPKSKSAQQHAAIISIPAPGGTGVGGGLSPEARAVISNMAIALDITSSRAWDMFSGPGGADEGRRLRAERAQQLAMASSNGDGGYAPPPPLAPSVRRDRYGENNITHYVSRPTTPQRGGGGGGVYTSGGSGSVTPPRVPVHRAYSPARGPGGYSPSESYNSQAENSRMNRNPRLLAHDNQLAANYYGGTYVTDY